MERKGFRTPSGVLNLDRCINVGIFGFCRIKGNADTCAGFHITGGDILCPLCKAGYGCAIASLKCDGICCMAYNCTADCAGKFPASKRIRIITGDCCNSNTIQLISLKLSCVSYGYIGAWCCSTFKVRRSLRQIYIYCAIRARGKNCERIQGNILNFCMNLLFFC